MSEMKSLTTILYSGKPNLQNTYLFFLQNVMRNQTLINSAGNDSFMKYYYETYDNLSQMDVLKINQESGMMSGNAFNFIN